MGGVLDAVTAVPPPVNEPVRSYAPGSKERASLEQRLKELGADAIDLPLTIGGERRAGGGHGHGRCADGCDENTPTNVHG